MKKISKYFFTFLLIVVMISLLAGCAEERKGKVHWSATGGDPKVEAQPTASPEQIVQFASYPGAKADSAIATILSTHVVTEEATGLWTEYESETTDENGSVKKVNARYDLQTGFYIYQETVDGSVTVENRFVLENGSYFIVEPISWIILKDLGDSYILITRDAIDSGRPFLDDYAASTWADSSMRDWLNGTNAYAKGSEKYAASWNFFDRAFTVQEQASIQVSAITTKNNASYQTAGGGETSDKVYLLSDEEVAEYFGEALTAQCGSTAYALHRGALVEGNQGLWWLRTPGINTYFQGVDRNGDVSVGGYSSADTDLGIRPVIRVSKSAVQAG